jgi:alpha-methylacyl-CoA racemase
MEPAGPLVGTTVLDLSTVGPAARCGRLLADYGATVVKVGAPPRAGTVQIEPPLHAYGGHRGMKRARIDLKAPGGRAAFLRLAERADVVLESLRPGVVDRLGIGWDDVRAVNPGVVYCSTSGYGQDGPRARWAGHDLDYLAVGGYLHCSGRGEDGAPAIPGATVADIAAGGMQAALAVTTALLERQRTGTGARLDVAVADGVLWMLSLAVDEHLATGALPGPGHDVLTGRYACYGLYRAGDDRWLAVAAIEPAFWVNLCRAVGLERWIPHQLDDAVQDEVRADLRAVLATRSRDGWVADLGPADTCVAPVSSVDEVVEDPQFAARGAFVEARVDGGARLRQVGPVLAGCAPVAAVTLRPPADTDTDELLRATGLADDDLRRLRDEQVVA